MSEPSREFTSPESTDAFADFDAEQEITPFEPTGDARAVQDAEWGDADAPQASANEPDDAGGVGSAEDGVDAVERSPLNTSDGEASDGEASDGKANVGKANVGEASDGEVDVGKVDSSQAGEESPASEATASPHNRAWPWDDDPLDPLPPNWPPSPSEMPTADFPAIHEPADPDEETRTVVLIPGRGYAAQPLPAASPPAPTTETAPSIAAPSPAPASRAEPPSAATTIGPTGNVSRPAKRRVRQTVFWPAFFASLLLCSVVSCGALGLLIGLDEVTLADIQGNPVWTPPPLTPTPTAAPAAPSVDQLAGRAAETFATGATVSNITLDRVNVRREPGLRDKRGGDILAQAAPEDTFTILGPSVRADNLIWWEVRHLPSNTVGWVAEATSSGVRILGN